MSRFLSALIKRYKFWSKGKSISSNGGHHKHKYSKLQEQTRHEAMNTCTCVTYIYNYPPIIVAHTCEL